MILKRGEAILFEMEEKLGFYKKYHNIGEKVSEVLNLTENIRDINSRHCRSVEISEFCDDIQAVLSPLTEQKQ